MTISVLESILSSSSSLVVAYYVHEIRSTLVQFKCGMSIHWQLSNVPNPNAKRERKLIKLKELMANGRGGDGGGEPMHRVIVVFARKSRAPGILIQCLRNSVGRRQRWWRLQCDYETVSIFICSMNRNGKWNFVRNKKKKKKLEFKLDGKTVATDTYPPQHHTHSYALVLGDRMRKN